MMSYIVVLLCLVILPFALIYPLVGLLSFIWLDFCAPQALFPGPGSDVRLSIMFTVAAMVGYLLFERPKYKSATFLTPLIFCFLIWATVTTAFAQLPDFAWFKWERFAKTQLVVLLLMIMIDSRERFELVLWTIIGALCPWIVRGFLVTLLSGGGADSVGGGAGTTFSDRNFMALVTLSSIPCALFLAKHRLLFKDVKLVTTGLHILVAFSAIMVIGSQSRGGFLAALGLISYLGLASGRFFRSMIGVAIVAGIALFFAPEAWFDRMKTISVNEGAEGQLNIRIRAWLYGLNIAQEFPIFGGGFGIYRLNFVPETEYGYVESHSIYFEVLGEHGFVGLTLLLIIILSTWTKLVLLRRTLSVEPWALAVATLGKACLITVCIGSVFLHTSQQLYF